MRQKDIIAVLRRLAVNGIPGNGGIGREEYPAYASRRAAEIFGLTEDQEKTLCSLLECREGREPVQPEGPADDAAECTADDAGCGIFGGEPDIVKLAELVAVLAHRGQKDKSGADYIGHPLAVASRLASKDEKAVGLLHDTLEDTAVTFEDLRLLFGDRIAGAVLRLTHEDTPGSQALSPKQKEERYMEYVRGLKNDPLARAVKMADLSHNMDLSRIPRPTERDHARVEKYRRAWALLAED